MKNENKQCICKINDAPDKHSCPHYNYENKCNLEISASPESKEIESVPVEMTQDRVIEFVDWINNNWFIPSEDSFWKLDTTNIEYQRTIPKKDVDLFEADELLQMFLKGEGES